MSSGKYCLSYLVITGMKTAWWPCFDVSKCIMEVKFGKLRWAINHNKHITHSVCGYMVSQGTWQTEKFWWSENVLCNISTFWNVLLHSLWLIYGLYYKMFPVCWKNIRDLCSFWVKHLYITLRPSCRDHVGGSCCFTLLYCYWFFTAVTS